MKSPRPVAIAVAWLALVACGPAVSIATAAEGSNAAAIEVEAPAPAPSRTIRVTSNEDSGPGSLRAAIDEVNHAARASYPGESVQQRASRRAVIQVAVAAERVLTLASALPDIEAPGTVLDGGGVTIRQGSDCRRGGGQVGCDGVAVSGPDVTVRRLRIVGFLFDGVAVRGRAARNVRIQDVHAIDNLDDGIGVSAGAGPVLIEDCLLMGNGYRTKGKGVLVFDDSRVLIRDSVAVLNRDGVSVTRRASAQLERVWIVGSYDKGLGVSGGSAGGKDNRLIANGDGFGFAERPPNADGLRVGLGGSADLRATRIEANGDAGVVALDTSSIVLHGGVVRANRGYGITCQAQASVRAEGVTLQANGKGNLEAARSRCAVVTTPPAGAR